MKKLLVLILCLSLTGCSAFSKNYLYTPTPLALATQRALTAGSTVPIMADIDVAVFADNVKQAWHKRQQISQGIGISSDMAEAGLGALPVIGQILGFVVSATPIGAIVSVASSLIGKLVGAINPSQREGAYTDGIKIISDGEAEYYAAAKTGAGDKTLTVEGSVLLKKVNEAIYKVESVLAGHVPDTGRLP